MSPHSSKTLTVTSQPPTTLMGGGLSQGREAWLADGATAGSTIHRQRYGRNQGRGICPTRVKSHRAVFPICQQTAEKKKPGPEIELLVVYHAWCYQTELRCTSFSLLGHILSATSSVKSVVGLHSSYRVL